MPILEIFKPHNYRYSITNTRLTGSFHETIFIALNAVALPLVSFVFILEAFNRAAMTQQLNMGHLFMIFMFTIFSTLALGDLFKLSSLRNMRHKIFSSWKNKAIDIQALQEVQWEKLYEKHAYHFSGADKENLDKDIVKYKHDTQILLAQLYQNQTLFSKEQQFFMLNEFLGKFQSKHYAQLFKLVELEFKINEKDKKELNLDSNRNLGNALVLSTPENINIDGERVVVLAPEHKSAPLKYLYHK